jgi:hypothetical protein
MSRTPRDHSMIDFDESLRIAFHAAINGQQLALVLRAWVIVAFIAHRRRAACSWRALLGALNEWERCRRASR